MRGLALLAGVLAGCATAPAMRGPAGPVMTAPGGRPQEVAPAVEAVPKPPAAVRVFRRPTGCADPTRGPGHRETVRCSGEERREVRLLPDGTLQERPLPPAASPGPVPIELAGQWRWCPFAADPDLEARPDAFVRYEDADVGACWLRRDAPPRLSPEAAKAARVGMLESLHPYLADRLRELHARLAAEGIAVRFISGVREHSHRDQWVTKTVKRKGRKVQVKVKQAVRRRTWHTWGLAVDLNLAHRTDLASASRAFRKDPGERAAWERVGAIARELGLTWGGLWDDGEIFHLEWHPGLPGLPTGDVHDRLAALRKSARGRLTGAWEVLRFDPARRSAFHHLRDALENRTIPAD